MRVLTAGIYAAIVLGSPASSQGYHASGTGTGSCEAFAKHRRENSKEEVIYFTWAQGYLSGLNTAQHLNGDRLRNLSAWTTDMQMAQIRVHCERFPTSPYFMAVFDLYSALPFEGDHSK